jgi:hypothetical protein
VLDVNLPTPREEIFAPFVQLFSAVFVREVTFFERVLGKVEDLVGLASKVVNVLFLALDTRQASAGADATEHERAVLRHMMQQRIAGVFTILYLVA